LFWIASQSKPITAAAVMMLVDEGRVNVTDPVEAQVIKKILRVACPEGHI